MITNDLFSGGADEISESRIPSGLAPGNFSADPLFANAASGNYQLLNGSSAIDAGTNSAPQLFATDFYDNPRIAIGYAGDPPVVDMGVAEVQTPGPKPSFTPTTTATPTLTPSATPTQAPTPTPTPVPESLKVTPSALTFKKGDLRRQRGDSSPSKTITFENKMSGLVE